jgi:hypothetical protein
LAQGFGRVFVPNALQRKYPYAGSIHTPTANGAGSGSFCPHRSAWTRGPGSTGDIICMNWCSNELSKRPRAI